MNINYTARHASITPDIKQYCEKRLKSLEKVMGYKLDADIILSVEKYRRKVEINVKTKRSILNAVEETHEMSNSLAAAFDNIEKRAKKRREKLREGKRRKNRERGAFALSSETEKRRGRIVRSSDYSMKPMSLEEAILQFDLNKKEVFVFRKLGSEKWAVIYRRKDGNYGLVEPE